jgi:hypothetical protein
MKYSGLFTSEDEINQIKENINRHDWYKGAFDNIKSKVDLAANKGFKVPNESGFVFFETCPRDDTHLIHNPHEPGNRICPTCGMNYKDEPYRRSWVTFQHAWLSQMGVLVGIVYQIEKDEKYANIIRKILLEYLKYYPSYPNNDNELGPTKVFQSTYMESVWIAYLAGAYDMVRRSNCFSGDERKEIENDLFKVSANIILDYDEKMNNRQAFNNSGLCAVGLLIGDDKLVDYSLNGIHGFTRHMRDSVLEDGLWYEGDNYHFATVPSLVNIAEMCRHQGIDLYSKEYNGHTLKMMFDAPLKSLQPDLTFPSRKDSRYANHIAQKWYAGFYELAYSRYKDPAYAKILKIMYDHKCPEDFNPPNAAGIIDILKAEVSRRNNLDWRGFLNANPELGDETGLPINESINMGGTGLAILRKKERKTYVSLDYGNYGGGHGHPDRLNIQYFTNGHRWLADWGTGNYYFDHLHWYRSTIAHNTIGVDGQTQMPRKGECILFEDNSEISIASAKVEEIAPGVNMNRTLILLKDGNLIDIMKVKSEERHQYHYALHSFGELSIEEKSFEAVNLDGDNYRFLRETYGTECNDNWTAKFDSEGAKLLIRGIGDETTKLYKGKAYGPPDQIPKLFPVLIVEKNKESAEFITLMESVEAGCNTQIVNFQKLKDNYYRVSYENNSYYDIIDENGEWKILECKEGKSIIVFGSMNEEKPSHRTAKVKSNRVFAGITNVLEIELNNYTGENWIEDVEIEIPLGWKLVSKENISLNPYFKGTIKVSFIPEITIDKSNKYDMKFMPTGDEWVINIEEPITVEEWIPKDQGSIMKILFKNNTMNTIDVQCSLIDEIITLNKDESKEYIIPISAEEYIKEDKFNISYEIITGSFKLKKDYSRPIAKVKMVGREDTLDSFKWEPNILLKDRLQVRRAEKHWTGLEDLSGEGMLIGTEQDLVLRMRVADNNVLFSGGKFYYDNDSIQVYFDRREEKYRNVTSLTKNIYGFITVPGVCDNCSTVKTAGTNIEDISRIGISMHKNDNGYEALVAIPWEIIGGRPSSGDLWGFDLIINDRDSGVRRDLQMVWSSCASDERIYLMQEHHNPRRFGLILFE